MTIDKAILRVEHSSMNVDDKETADFIINTMRKYQKIQIAMDNRADDYAESNSKALNEIEVIMYGNDDW